VAAGFNDALFAPFFDALEQPSAPSLHYADLAHSEVAGMVQQFRIQFDGHIGFVTFLRGVQDPAALATRFQASEEVLFLDQAALMKSATKQYNRRVAQLLSVGLVAILAILWLRYRRLSVALATLIPAVLAGGLAVLALSVFELKLDALGLTGILMVLSMGVDYSVFMAEAAGYGGDDENGGEMGATVLGVIVDWFTTVFGFGLLAFSHYPAMRIIGIVAGLGITAALVLAPATLALVSPRRQNGQGAKL
jgi:predicted exporter